jgi:hypothetical protein
VALRCTPRGAAAPFNCGWQNDASQCQIETRLLAMSHRIIATIIGLLALQLAVASTARAQSVADAENALHAMDMRMRALTIARKNLQQMRTHRDNNEADAVREITDADTNVFSAAVKVFTVAYILTGVKCPEDLHFVQKQFRLVVGLFVTTADAELSRVNTSLHSVAAPTTLAEATHVQAAIADLRDFLKPFAAEI